MEEAAAAFAYVESQCNLQAFLLQVSFYLYIFFFFKKIILHGFLSGTCSFFPQTLNLKLLLAADAFQRSVLL